MRGDVSIVRSDAEQPYHVRLAAASGQPISASEQLVAPHTAGANVLAQARVFGYDNPHLVHLSATEALLYSGLTISGHPIDRDIVIAHVTYVDERSAGM